MAQQLTPGATSSSSSVIKPTTSTIKLTRVINNFSKLDCRWYYSTVFVVGGYEWRLLVHPGEKGKDTLWVSLGLSASQKLPSGWWVNIDFSSTLVNQIYNKDSIKKCNNLLLTKGGIDSGYVYFMYVLVSEGYVVNDKVIVETHLSVQDSSSSNKQILLLATPDIPSVICSSSTTTFTWVINNFTKLKVKCLGSDVFFAGEYQWKLYVYPEGKVWKYLSVYLQVVSPTRLLPITVEFNLRLVNQILNNDSFQIRTEHQFREGHISWGFPNFMCFTEVKDPSKGYLVQDTVTIEVNMSVFHSSSCDSEKEIEAKMIPLIPATGDTISATFLEKTKHLSKKLASFEMAQKSNSASSSTISGSALQQQRKAFKEYLALSSLEAIDQANAFDEIERLALLLVQHSESSLESAILRDLLSSRLPNLKDVVPATKASIKNLTAQKETLSVKKVVVRSRLNQGKEQLSILEVEFSKLLEEESELEAQVLRLISQREKLLITKNLVALEMEKINVQVATDLEEPKEIRKKDEHAVIDWIQTTEKLARANLSWQLFKQNLELCENSV